MSDETETPTNDGAAPQPNVSVSIHSQDSAPVNTKAIMFTVEQLAELFTVATQLVALLQKVQTDSADAWGLVRDDFESAAEAFRSVKAPGQVVPEQPAAITYGGADELPAGEHAQAVTPHAEPPVTVAGTQV